MSAITLNDYQIEPIHKLLVNKLTTKGLLLWYSMGTGKTLVALSYLLNYPNQKVNIICPEDIIFVWEEEIKKIPQIKNNITFFSYEKSHVFLSKNTYKNEIIIIDEAQHLVPILKLKSENISASMNLLNTCCKILLLTGTPIYNEFTDIVYLVNLASGKTLIPYNDTKFKDVYFKVNKLKSAIVGHAIPNFLAFQKYGYQLGMLTTISLPSLFLLLTKNFSGLGKFANLPHMKLWNSLGQIGQIKLQVVMTVFPMILEFIYKSLSYKTEDYKDLNTELLVKDVSPFISYYKNKYNVKSIDNPFPNTQSVTKIVNYSETQLEKWLELTQGVMNIKTIEDLNIASKKEAEFFSKKIDIEIYLTNGVIIGNLSDDKGYFSPKFCEILKESKGKRAVFYSNFTVNGILLFKDFLESKKEKYLYLDKGISNKSKNDILSTFEKTTTFLLLHPSYTEGITIKGSEQLHLLEPIRQNAKKEQIVARVVRYKSHHHLPIEKRNVSVYQWASGSTNPIQKLLKSVKTWSKYNPEVSYLVDFSKFKQDMSPDVIILKNQKTASKQEQDIVKLLEAESKTNNIQCCIKFPSKKQEQECLQILKKSC